MRFAIVSDIHANLQAWMAVHSDIMRLQVDRIISLGDMIGYGPNPLEVCMLSRRQIHYHLVGNHDAAIAGRTPLEKWNRRARQIIAWTRQRLPQNHIDWFGSLSYTLATEQFRCAHSEFSKPSAFYYITRPEHVVHSWRKVSEQLLFAGHTHRPTLYVLGESGIPHQLEPQPFVCEPGKRYLVNVGSVGFPRDVQDSACYCIFDARERSVFWRRVSFDYEGYQVALESQGFLESAPQPGTGEADGPGSDEPDEPAMP